MSINIQTGRGKASVIYGLRTAIRFVIEETHNVYVRKSIKFPSESNFFFTNLLRANGQKKINSIKSF